MNDAISAQRIEVSVCMGELKNENVVLSTEMMQPGSKLLGSGFGFFVGGEGVGGGKGTRACTDVSRI